jgi:hypothetical protein
MPRFASRNRYERMEEVSAFLRTDGASHFAMIACGGRWEWFAVT